MDLFNRLRHRMTLSRAAPKPTSSAQLEKFHSCWTYCHSTYFMQDQKDSRKVHVQLTEIPLYLKTMVDILVQEEIRQENEHTGACMEYMLKHDVLGVLVNISEADFPLGIRGETIRTITTLVNLLDVKFLVHAAVHIPTLKLLKASIQDERSADKFSNFYVDDLIDLLYTLCSKIHASPQLLTIFFYDRRWLTTPHRTPASASTPTSSLPSHRHDLAISNKFFSPVSDDASAMTSLSTEETVVSPSEPSIIIDAAPRTHPSSDKPDYECLLFSYLLKFIHRDGKSGDCARTGLLFLVEISSGTFRDYVLHHSDLCQILAAGLGALYSQLPRKLLVRHSDSGPSSRKALASAHMLVTRSSSLDSSTELELFEFEVASSPAFKALIDSFLKTLEFCQDVLQRCPSRAICMSLLSDIRGIFMESILYPSMLESSDTDGSAVAVISYIEIILLTLQDGELLDLFLRYLISSDDDSLFPVRPVELVDTSETSSLRSNTSSQVGSTKDGSSRPTNKVKDSSFLAFNLKDLLYNNLQSTSTPTAIAALKLLNTIVSKHPQYCLPLLTTENHFPIALSPTPALTSSVTSSFDDPESLSPPEPAHVVTMTSHYQESQAYFLLINNLDPRFNADGWIPGFEPYLRNIESGYRSYHSFNFVRQQQAKSKGHVRKQTLMAQSAATAPEPLVKDLGIKQLPTPRERHCLRREDPLLTILMSLVSQFFDNPCELNLVLTGLLTSLAGCPFVTPDEWVSFTTTVLSERAPPLTPYTEFEWALATPLPRSPSLLPDLSRPFDDDASDDDMDLIQLASLPPPARSDPHRVHPRLQVTFQPDHPPPIFNTLNQLAQEVSRRRRHVPDLDTLLEERRRQLLLNDMDRYGSACLGSFTNSPVLTSPSATGPDTGPLSLFKRTLSAAPKIPFRRLSKSAQDPQPLTNPKRKLSLISPVMLTSPEIVTKTLSDPVDPDGKAPIHASPYFSAPATASATDSFPPTSQPDILLPSSHSPPCSSPIATSPAFPLPTSSPSSPPPESPLILADNILILAEFIKELVATLHVRRGQGLDEVLFI